MALVDRVKNICLTPNTEWPVIAGETTPPAALVTGYVAPLAAIGAAAAFIGGSLVGRTLPFVGTYRVPLTTGLGLAVFTFVMAIVGIFVLAFIINALAPNFGGEKNSGQAWKLAVYSYTPAWVAGALQIIPALGALAIIGGLYGLYLLYLGLPRLMKCPADKAVAYTAVVVVCAVVLSVVVAGIGASLAGAGMLAGGAFGASRAPAGSGGEVQFDRNSALGKLQDLGQKLDESNKKMEAAAKRGDQAAEANAAMESLGTLLGGGSRVEPVDIEQLKPFIPATFAGLPKTSSNAEKNGLGGVTVSKAEASYGDGAAKHVTLDVSDSGGVSGLVGLASWAGMQQQKEDDNGSERTEKVDGRLVHEKSSKTGGTNEYSIVLGNRFIVSAEGQGVDLGALKAAVSALDLGKLESMKATGVQK